MIHSVRPGSQKADRQPLSSRGAIRARTATHLRKNRKYGLFPLSTAKPFRDTVPNVAGHPFPLPRAESPTMTLPNAFGCTSLRRVQLAGSERIGPDSSANITREGSGDEVGHDDRICELAKVGTAVVCWAFGDSYGAVGRQYRVSDRRWFLPRRFTLCGAKTRQFAWLGLPVWIAAVVYANILPLLLPFVVRYMWPTFTRPNCIGSESRPAWPADAL